MRIAPPLAIGLVGLVALTGACADGSADAPSGTVTNGSVTNGSAPDASVPGSADLPPLAATTAAALEDYRAMMDRSTPVGDTNRAAVALADQFLPAGLPITGIEHWGWSGDDGSIIETEKIAFGTLVDEAAFSALEASPPTGWLTTGDVTTNDLSTLTFNADDGSAAIVFVSRNPSEDAFVPTEFFHQPVADSIWRPGWIDSLPVPAGGRLAEVRQTVGYSQFFPASLFARWRYPADQRDAIIDFLRRELPRVADISFPTDEPQAFTDVIALRIGDWTGDVSIVEGLDGTADNIELHYYFRLA